MEKTNVNMKYVDNYYYKSKLRKEKNVRKIIYEQGQYKILRRQKRKEIMRNENI